MPRKISIVVNISILITAWLRVLDHAIVTGCYNNSIIAHYYCTDLQTTKNYSGYIVEANCAICRDA